MNDLEKALTEAKEACDKKTDEQCAAGECDYYEFCTRYMMICDYR